MASKMASMPAHEEVSRCRWQGLWLVLIFKLKVFNHIDSSVNSCRNAQDFNACCLLLKHTPPALAGYGFCGLSL
jgi:hypothetical protein